MIQLLNVRRGFATNSSSSHSLIFKGANPYLPNSDTGGVSSWGGYGWENFVLVSKEAKLNYLGCQVGHVLERAIGRTMAEMVLKELTEGRYSLARTEDDYGLGGSVDHSSQWEIPIDLNSGVPNMDFLLDLKKFLLRKDLYILGGNDNEESPRYTEGSFGFIREGSFTQTGVARKDSQYGYWAFFNPRTGAKLRMILSEDSPQIDPLKAPVVRSSLPELVDIAITKHCPYNCSYCYSNSTAEGKHASMENLTNIAECLAQMKVFEVALGGGEPTLHPNFVEILKLFRSKGIVPNFSTKNLDWLMESDWQSWFNLCGSFAFSVPEKNPEKAVSTFLKVVEKKFEDSALDLHNRQHPALQLVWGAHPEKVTKSIFKLASDTYGLNVVLLGFKNVGRGCSGAPYELPSPLKLWGKNGYWNLGVDTELARQYEWDLKAKGISPLSYYTEEGNFSCAIDAVEMTVSPSSFSSHRTTLDPKLSTYCCSSRVFSRMAESIRGAYLSFQKSV